MTPSVQTPRVEVLQLDAAALRGLADGDLAAANRTSPVPVTPYLAGAECRGVWEIRAVQVVQDPASRSWITGVVWDPDRRRVVGRAGYHGPPDADGMVEVGYSIDPQYRRQGYARAALRALVERARQEPGVTTLRATVSPDNAPSRDLVLSEGLVEVGEQMDEEDGLELIYELVVSPS
ncbi:MAG: family acetyltransferase [Blastococcus sp.]|jgi:RimJ/RimL family protein N-acetyltransferase|nr:family acetyltransferase [Blastococcus sp.]